MEPARREHVLIVFTNPEPGCDDEYNDWYTNRHLGDVLKLDEFVAAQRFVLDEAPGSRSNPPTRYLAIYELAEGVTSQQAAAAFIAARRDSELPTTESLGDSHAWYFKPISERKTG